MGLTTATEVYFQYTTFGFSPMFSLYRPLTLPEDNGGLLHPVINMVDPVKFFIC
jgi:hypothetical protein